MSRRSKALRKQPARTSASPAAGIPGSALSPLTLASVAAAALASLAALPRVHASLPLAASVLGAAALLAALQVALRWRIRAAARQLVVLVAPRRVHWVQASMQGCVYAYWGWYWPEVYAHVPLIAAQLVFAYGLDMLVCWLRRDEWVLGFGPFPIIFSTNLFMWFRDDWFALQFAMVATGVLGKEFVKWRRDGQSTHVFNPSALSLALFSLVLIVTQNTRITWGQDIAATLGLPPNIYLEVFLVGLVVQILFSVTLVTLAATAALLLLNLAYTDATGTYLFVMTNIPIAVFLGLHLLVTDPATSPRTTLGKMIFGALYGGLAFALFGLFSRLGVPTFYDKLLPVPVLNLTVRWLDRVSRRLAESLPWLEPTTFVGPRRLNLAAVSVWVALFAAMAGSGFLGKIHPGRDQKFWRQACSEDRFGACKTWATFLDLSCPRDTSSCLELGELMRDGRGVPRDTIGAAKTFVHACDGGRKEGCEELRKLAVSEGPGPFRDACDRSDDDACFMLGELEASGIGMAREPQTAFRRFERLCREGRMRGCARLGDSYLSGEGTGVDIGKAIASLDRACAGGQAVSCVQVARVYRRDIGGANDEVASERLRRACELGFEQACGPGEHPAPRAGSSVDEAIAIQRLGG